MPTPKNPFPSGGVTRLGVSPDIVAAIPSQGGAIERLETAIASVVRHGVKRILDDREVEILRGKPEFFMLRGEFGTGKSLALAGVFEDCKAGNIRLGQGQAGRKALVIPIYQPLHAFVTDPGKLLEVLTDHLIAGAPTPNIRDLLEKTRKQYENSIIEKDDILKRILVWNYCCDAAIRNNVDAVVILLDEIEESVKDYDQLKPGYAQVFSLLREFTDRHVGPIVTVLGITPKAIDSLVEQTKEALLRRMVIIDLPRLTSIKEFVTLAKVYDQGLESYVNAAALETIFKLTVGNPGFGLASLHWAWEEMRARGLEAIDRQLASEAVASIGWKGEKISSPILSAEVEARYPTARLALDRTREVLKEFTPSQVIAGTVSALNAIAILKEPQGIVESLDVTYGNREDITQAMAEVGLSLYSEPNVQYSLLVFFAQDGKPNDDGLKQLLSAWGKTRGDICLVIAPSSASEFRRSLDRVSMELQDHKGLPMRETILTIFLQDSDLLEFASLANMQGAITEIKSAQKLVCEKYKVGQLLEDKIRQFREIGRTIPYRWEAKYVTKEVQWGIYKLLAKRFTSLEFSPKEAISFILDHYQLDEDTRKWYDAVRSGLEGREFNDKVSREVVGVLETLADQGFSVKRGSDFYIPTILSYEKQLYNEVKRIKNQEGKNPAYDDLKFVFFGYVPKGNNIFGLACGMEGKGYVRCINLGPRRFYGLMEFDERYSQVQIALKNLRETLEETIGKISADLGGLNSKTPDGFSDYYLSASTKNRAAIEEGLQKALSKEVDEFERLRMASGAETEVLILIDQGVAVAEEYLKLESSIRATSLDVDRLDRVLKDFESKRVSKEKTQRIRNEIDVADKLSQHALAELKGFRVQEARKVLSKLQDQHLKIEAFMEEEFQEVAAAEKSLATAIENLKGIENVIRVRQEQSRLLGLDSELKTLTEGVESARSAMVRGKFEEVKTEPPLIFLRRFLQPKLQFINDRMGLLKETSQLLVDLGQSSLADDVEIGVRRIEREYEKAVGSSAKSVEDLIDHSALATENLQKMDKVFDRLRTLFSGAVRTNRNSFREIGVDSAVADTLNFTSSKARKLRHILEDLGYVKVIDIEISA